GGGGGGAAGHQGRVGNRPPTTIIVFHEPAACCRGVVARATAWRGRATSRWRVAGSADHSRRPPPTPRATALAPKPALDPQASDVSEGAAPFQNAAFLRSCRYSRTASAYACTPTRSSVPCTRRRSSLPMAVPTNRSTLGVSRA